MPDPSGPFCASNWSKSLNPGACPLFGPPLSPGSLLVKVFGRLIAVLVANSVPLRAGCGRPDTELLFSNDCSCTALGSLERVCAVDCSISFRTEFTSRLFHLWLVGQHVAHVIRQRCARLNFFQ